MKNYMIAISISQYVNDAADPRVYFDTYKEASEAARPWVEQGYKVIITTMEYEEDGE
ncbi:MAG: hypothetical protein Q4C52_04775 [Eubacteriales bacterium]|nr:hypothetical protein [Eubacteriales bacterium]